MKTLFAILLLLNGIESAPAQITQEWVARYNGPGNSGEFANSLAVDGSGNVYVTGYSTGSGTSVDYATIKYNSSGVQQWVARYNGPGNGIDEASSIAVDGSDNVYVTGRSEGLGTTWDYATIKYSQSIGIRQLSSLIPEQFSLSQNFPNPFNPVTKINYDVTHAGRVSLIVFDILGRYVTTLVNENQSPGTYQVELDGSNLSSGVYFYKLETDGFTDVKSMMVVK